LEIFHSISEFHSSIKTVVTIGTFDGVHIGHQKILKDLIATAQAENKKSVVLTFFPHPRMVLQKNVDIKLINTMEEKANLLEELGIDYLIIHPFDNDFSRLTALDFVRDVLVNQLNISKLVIGYDHHFGKNREGNIEQLTEYSHLYDFTVNEIPAQAIDQVSVSSTKVRNALKEGNLKTANNYLGYPFSLTGLVEKGKQIGSEIGFPTANIRVLESYKLIPKNGAYVVKTNIDNKTVFGMMNIGYRPTLKGENKTIEVHLFNFNENLYDTKLQISVLYFLREEQKFDSIEKLQNQLKTDQKSSYIFLLEAGLI